MKTCVICSSEIKPGGSFEEIKGKPICMDCFRFIQGQSPLPTSEEETDAAERIKALDQLAPHCHWELTEYEIDNNTRSARERWDRIMKIQDEYESKYC